MKISRAAIFVLLLLMLAGLVGRRDFEERNIRIFAEMAASPAVKPQETVPRLPPAGTIARGRLADGEPVPRTWETLARGRALYESFCRHCHGAAGRGDGGVAMRFSGFAMSIVGTATADLSDDEIFAVVSNGRNHMPPHAAQIEPADRRKLIHYLRDLQRAGGPGLPTDPRRDALVSADYGREIFDGNCASCHGAEGRTPKPGVPTLNHPRVLAVADDDFYVDIISHGRKGTEMPAWDKILSPTQIRSLARYIRSWYPEVADPSRMKPEAGSVGRGASLFRGNCAACHGKGAQGGIGNSLNSPSFQAMASDAFLRDTIMQGRGHTAMPSWSELREGEVSDLLAFLRTWGRPAHTFEDVRPILSKADAKIGAKLFRARCSACHEDRGEGGIGSTLNSPSFLASVDDEFLYRSIVEGRPGTAMPSWHHLSKEDVADLIAFVRTWQKEPARDLASRPRRGRAEFGELLYQQACVMCHGPDGAGGVGGQIGNPTFLSCASDEFLWNTIAYGKDRTGMRGFLKGAPGGELMAMTPDDIDHLVAYLRRLQASLKPEPLMRRQSATSVALGRQIYEEKGACAKCHGAAGEGGTGPALGNPDFLRTASDGFLIGTIVLGREHTEMLPFTGASGNVLLSRQELENVVAYVRTFEQKAMPRRRAIDRSETTLAEGRALFASFCAPCHGSEGRGPRGNAWDGYAPSLNNKEFLRAADDGFLLATIALGRAGTPMRPFAEGVGGIADLSPDEIRKIVAFIRSWEEP